PVAARIRISSAFAPGRPKCLMFAQANPPPRMNPSRGARGHPLSTVNARTPLRSVTRVPTIVVGPTRKRCASCCSIRSEEHTSELQSLRHLVCRLLLEKKKLISFPKYARHTSFFCTYVSLLFC